MSNSKREIEKLEKRIELLELELKELKTVQPDAINERFSHIEEALYSTKDVLNMKDVCQYLDISPSLLYKMTCNGEIPHFKPRGKMVFFCKNELVEWAKQNHCYVPREFNESVTSEPNEFSDNEKENSEKEQH